MNSTSPQFDVEQIGGEHKAVPSHLHEKPNSPHPLPSYQTSPIPTQTMQPQMTGQTFYTPQATPQTMQQPQVYQIHPQPYQIQQPLPQTYEMYPQQQQATYTTKPPMAMNIQVIPQAPQPAPYLHATPIRNLNMSSTVVDCPYCSSRGMTSTSYHTGNTTHIWGAVLCVLTCFFCFVPYLMNGLKDVQHRCSACGQLLATWHKSGETETHGRTN